MESVSREPQYKPHGADSAPIMLVRSIVFCVLPMLGLLCGIWVLRQAARDASLEPVARALYFTSFGLVGALIAVSVASALLNRQQQAVGPPRNAVGFGFLNTTFRHKWSALTDAAIDIEWTRMHRWPAGGAIASGRRCTVCGCIELEAVDAAGRWCLLYGRVDTRHWVSWMAGAFVGVAYNRSRSGRKSRFVGGLWRMESNWIRHDTPQSDVPGVSFTWRSRSSGGERIHALDTFGRDIVLYRDADCSLEFFVTAGPFIMWSELPVFVSTDGTQPARAA